MTFLSGEQNLPMLVKATPLGTQSRHHFRDPHSKVGELAMSWHPGCPHSIHNVFVSLFMGVELRALHTLPLAELYPQSFPHVLF